MHIKRSFASEEELKETLDFIYAKSGEGKGFNGILEAALNEVTIVTAIHNIKSNKGANTPGVDGSKMNDYLKMDRDELIMLLRKTVQDFIPKPVRRIFIKKSNGKLRPLGIPAALEKILQECIKIIIEPICEAKFYPKSFGFRPYRATNHAMKELITLLSMNSKSKPIIAIEGDIASFFDNMNHKILIRKLYKIGVCDKRILCIIKKMLTAGYIYQSEEVATETGAVQGGVISPLLANVYLNDCDWTIGRMYQLPKDQKHKSLDTTRAKLRRKGINPKYLVRFADDWIILTTVLSEAVRMLSYLQKYYKHRLKLNLSEEKTFITNLTEKRARFLGFELEASPPRGSPSNIGRKNVVGKFYPDKEKAKAKVEEICKEIRILKDLDNTQYMAAQIEKINSKITGVANYYKVAICSYTFSYIDKRINETSYRTFKKKYPKDYKLYRRRLCELSNRPERHQKRRSSTFAINHKDMWIGITKAYITHSQWDKYSFNAKLTPYTAEGRSLYLEGQKRKKKLPLNRPPIYDEATLFHCKDKDLNNFEYYMNREYAYNRDKGRCRICAISLGKGNRECHRTNQSLEIQRINKTANLAWLCKVCFNALKEKVIPPNASSKVKSKFSKFLNIGQNNKNDPEVVTQ